MAANDFNFPKASILEKLKKQEEKRKPYKPKSKAETRSKRICVLITPSLLESLDGFCEEFDVSRNDIINRLVEDLLNEQK